MQAHQSELELQFELERDHFEREEKGSARQNELVKEAPRARHEGAVDH
jgi:hypothetical protein